MNNCSNSCRINPCRRSNLYAGGALCFLALVLLFTIGLIVGAVNYETFLPVLAAVIAFAAAIAAIMIALLIYWFVCRHNR